MNVSHDTSTEHDFTDELNIMSITYFIASWVEEIEEQGIVKSVVFYLVS